ncbi:MAG: hypothetical protein JXR37_23295 [Kiritimatiellae bacterium]|nr:hypothetical protein [Kiritimatiellia bacterium]
MRAENAAGDSPYAGRVSATTPPDGPAPDFEAYNDLAWAAGQLSANITTHTAGDRGIRVDYVSGRQTPVTLAIAGPAPADVLRPDRGALSVAAGFLNVSSIGARYDGSGDPAAETVNGYNLEKGYVARFAAIDPGPDPLGAAECFGVHATLSGGQVVVSFQTVAAAATGCAGLARYYALETAANGAPQLWTPMPGLSCIPGTNQVVAYPAPSGGGAFYRARVWLED